MSMNGLSHTSRIACLVLAVGVHAAAASAFMLAPREKPPAPPAAVEIALLAEITAEAADEAAPAVAAESMEARQASEAQPGEAQDIVGKEIGELAALNVPQNDVKPTEAKEIEEARLEPEAEDISEVEPVDEPPVATPVEPVEIEKPVVEAPDTPALPKKPAPAKKKVQKQIKTQQQRARVAATTPSRNVGRIGTSPSKASGGRQASAAYRSIVNARLAARRTALQAAARGTKGRVTISFTIGSGGSVVATSVSSSSGDARLDAAARSVVATTSFPPPPGGAFRSGVPFLVK